MALIRNRKALGAVLIAIIVIVAVVIVVGAVFALVWFFSSPGPTKTQEYTNAGFTGLDVGSAIQVNVKQAETYSIKITAGERIIDQLQVTQTDGTLKIEVVPGIFWGTFDVKAEITMPTLNEFALSGASRGTMDGFNSTNQFTTRVSGASQLDITNTQTGDFNIQLSGASRLTGQGNGGDLFCDVSGASNMELENFSVNDANVNLSGASRGVVNADGTLTANASGASSLQYVGNPTLGNINTSGASTVNRK